MLVDEPAIEVGSAVPTLWVAQGLLLEQRGDRRVGGECIVGAGVGAGFCWTLLAVSFVRRKVLCSLTYR